VVCSVDEKLSQLVERAWFEESGVWTRAERIDRAEIKPYCVFLSYYKYLYVESGYEAIVREKRKNTRPMSKEGKGRVKGALRATMKQGMTRCTRLVDVGWKEWNEMIRIWIKLRCPAGIDDTRFDACAVSSHYILFAPFDNISYNLPPPLTVSPNAHPIMTPIRTQGHHVYPHMTYNSNVAAVMILSTKLPSATTWKLTAIVCVQV
jgi:hypothetical protein